MHGILALAVGPLLLVFAWATYVRAPHRYGTVQSTRIDQRDIFNFITASMP
jgi:hypothetical protein